MYTKVAFRFYLAKAPTDSYWARLRPESALLARAFAEHCIAKGDQALLESVLPVVTALAFQIQNQYNLFLEKTQEAEELEERHESRKDDETEAREEESADAEFIIAELLNIAVLLDYSDEIGRRKMFDVISTCCYVISAAKGAG